MSNALLAGRSVLVVEDEYLMAMSLAEELQDAGATVIGPAASVSKATTLIEHCDAIDFALLDLNLGGERAYPLADLLNAKGVPFVFLTGYDAGAVLEAYQAVGRLRKPLAATDVVRHVGHALGAAT